MILITPHAIMSAWLNIPKEMTVSEYFVYAIGAALVDTEIDVSDKI